MLTKSIFAIAAASLLGTAAFAETAKTGPAEVVAPKNEVTKPKNEVLKPKGGETVRATSGKEVPSTTRGR